MAKKWPKLYAVIFTLDAFEHSFKRGAVHELFWGSALQACLKLLQLSNGNEEQQQLALSR